MINKYDEDKLPTALQVVFNFGLIYEFAKTVKLNIVLNDTLGYSSVFFITRNLLN